ncbi:hypothetical protein B0H13DRAFT_1870085 [Mycena leptocephala]|nr:hypothetical protein B0H13DRAFT_1870085 [Mycena leptocephala]
MPPQPTVTQIRLNNITTCLTITANTLEILVGSLKSPLEAISNTTQSLLKNMETVKQNKNQCTQLLEQTYELLNTILMVHVTSDMGGELPPSVLKHIGKFTETLHKIHTSLMISGGCSERINENLASAMQRGWEWKPWARCRGRTPAAAQNPRLRSGECLRQASRQSTLNTPQSGSITAFTTKATFVEAQQNVNKLKNFFHQGEMSTLLKDCKAGLQQGFEIFQITMVNHIKDIAEMQEDAERRHKEVLDMIEALYNTTDSDGASSISWLYLGSHNSSNSISMLPSEPKIFHGRDSELSDILQLFSGMGKTSLARAVIHHTKITERYDQHRFFVACDSAATQVELAAFIGAHVGLKPGKDLTRPVIQYFSSSSECLLILDNLETLWEPLESRGKIEEFLSLLTAHLVDSEGCSHVLSRWDEEKTSLISDGYDRTSNLDLSISLSLSSPRLNTHPHSKDLLSLLSMLPDGLSDVELVQSKLPIDNIQHCKATLIRTSLAYSDDHKRLKVLVPIREYIQKIQPPGNHLIQPLFQHFQELLELFMEYRGNESSSSTIARISSNYSNIQNVLQSGLQQGHPDLGTLASDAQENFKEFDDPDLKCRFYNVLAYYYEITGDILSAKKFSGAAISLALSTGNTKMHSLGLCDLAWVEWKHGDYSTAQVHANEAQRLALISADLFREAQALIINATCCYTLGNYKKAMSLCIRARDLLGLCGISHGTLDNETMNCQAEIHKLKSEYVEARSIHNTILEGTTIQDPYTYGWALLNVADIDVLIGAPKNDVQRNCDRARKMLNTIGFAEGVTLCDVVLEIST